MNKLQWIIIILSLLGLFLYLEMGLNILVLIILVTVFIIAIYLSLKKRHCAKCGAKLPRLRKPQNKEQALYGGCTCPNCGAELDSSGNLRKNNKDS